MRHITKSLGRTHSRVLAVLSKRSLLSPSEIAERSGIDYKYTLQILYVLRACGHVNGMRQRRDDGSGWLRGRLWYRR